MYSDFSISFGTAAYITDYGPDDIFIRPGRFIRNMFWKSKKKSVPKEISPYGGLEDLTDEEIEKNIKDYPYVMGKLKDC